MRLLTVDMSGEARAGAMVGNDVLIFSAAADLIQDARSLPTGIRQLLGLAHGVDQARKIVDQVASDDSLRSDLARHGAIKPLADVRLLAPVTDPALILSIGSNSRKHIAEVAELLKETGQQAVVPPEPRAFTKSVASLIGSGSSIVIPRNYPTMVDWEGEFGFVIGRECYQVEEEDALDYLAGYTLINDVGARDYAFLKALPDGTPLDALAARTRMLLGKQHPTFCPMGPVIVTKDELPSLKGVRMEVTVNGELMQSEVGDDMIFDTARIIAHYSQFHKLLPGDVFTMGSPAGVGFSRKPPIFLKPGDVVDVKCDRIGVLSNPVVAQA